MEILGFFPDITEGAQLLQAAIVAVSAFVGWLLCAIGRKNKTK
jgi:hypothetical protein